MNFKAILKFISILLSAFAIYGLINLFFTQQKINQHDQAFNTITTSSTQQDIINLLGTPHQTLNAHVYTDTPNTDFSNFKHTLSYTVRTPFLPISWRFSIDQQNKVIAKHRYD